LGQTRKQISHKRNDRMSSGISGEISGKHRTITLKLQIP
jgi:hypothetical protein